MKLNVSFEKCKILKLIISIATRKPLRSFWKIHRIDEVNSNSIGDKIGNKIDNLGFNDLFFFILIALLLVSC